MTGCHLFSEISNILLLVKIKREYQSFNANPKIAMIDLCN